MNSPQEIREAIDSAVKGLEIDTWGVTTIPVQLRREYYLKWIEEKKHGDMAWMEQNNDKRLHPENLLEQAKSIICIGVNYYQEDPVRRGRIAKYALGRDYHKIIPKKLKQLCTTLTTLGGTQKFYVDTGPVLEKPIAALAGLGFQGKSTILIHKRQGTWLFIGLVITTLNIKPDTPTLKNYCGKCTACIDTCPTQAITAPFQLDASRCIAYLTIEHKGSIPLEFRRAIGDRVFGCDECLDVCPWNRFAKKTQEADFATRPIPDLRETLSWTPEDFKNQFQGTPVMRLKLPRWLRNACVVLGNTGSPGDLPALEQLASHEDTLVAEHAQWAIKEIKAKT